MDQENILYQLTLPSFMSSFKDQVLHVALPYLYSILRILKSNRTSQPQNQNPSNLQFDHQIGTAQIIIGLLITVIFIQILGTVFSGLFSKKQIVKVDKTGKQADESMAKQIMQLHKEIKSVRTALIQIIQLNEEKTTHQQTSSVKRKQINPNSQGINTESIKDLVKLYERSMESSNKIAEFMLEAQEDIVRQLKKLKKSRVHSESTPSHASAKNTSESKTRKKDKYSGRGKFIEQEEHVQEGSVSSNGNIKISSSIDHTIDSSHKDDAFNKEKHQIHSEIPPQAEQTQKVEQKAQGYNNEDVAIEAQQATVKREMPKPMVPSTKNSAKRPPAPVRKQVSPVTERVVEKEPQSESHMQPPTYQREQDPQQNPQNTQDPLLSQPTNLQKLQSPPRTVQQSWQQSKAQNPLQSHYQTPFTNPMDNTPEDMDNNEPKQEMPKTLPPVRKIPAPPAKTGARRAPPPPTRK